MEQKYRIPYVLSADIPTPESLLPNINRLSVWIYFGQCTQIVKNLQTMIPNLQSSIEVNLKQRCHQTLLEKTVSRYHYYYDTSNAMHECRVKQMMHYGRILQGRGQSSLVLHADIAHIIYHHTNEQVTTIRETMNDMQIIDAKATKGDYVFINHFKLVG